AEAGDLPQAWHAPVRLEKLVVDEAAEHEHVAVVDEHRRGDRSRIRHEIGGPLDGRGQARGLLLDVELDAAAFVDLRRDLQVGADLLALDGLERVHGALVGARIRELTRHERDFLTDADLGFLVVERDDLRRRDDVRLALAAQGVDQRRPAAGSRELADADRDALGNRREVRRLGGRRAREPEYAAAARVREIRDAEELVVRSQPGDAERRGLLFAELDDDRIDLDLQARYVDLVDDREHVGPDALRSVDDERVRAGVRPYRHGAARRRRRAFGRRGGWAAPAGAAELRLQLRREVFGVGIVEISDQRVAAFGRRRVEMRNQRAHLQLHGASPRQQHAVRAWVGDDLDRRIAPGGLGGRIELAQYPDDLVGRGVLELDHLDVLCACLVHAPDELDHAANVLRPIGDDQRIRDLVCGEMRRLRQQRPQDWHELLRADVVEDDRLRDVVFAGAEPRVRVGNDHDVVAGLERYEAVDLERGEEGPIERIGRHRGVRQDRQLGAYARVDDDRPPDDLLNLLDDHANVRVAVVRRVEHRLLRLSLRRAARTHAQSAASRAACFRG